MQNCFIDFLTVFSKIQAKNMDLIKKYVGENL